MNTIDKKKHLLRRAGFGWHPDEWAQLANQSLDQIIDQLFQQADQAKPIPFQSAWEGMTVAEFKMLDKAEKQAKQKEDRQFIGDLNANWIRRMTNPQESALLERVCLFWHGHFACTSKQASFAAQQLNTIREHGLGNFRDLLIAISKDASMLRFLNNQQNKKGKPNENYARELMELFTIGRGHYTEQDVKESARAFTGWMSRPRGQFFFNRRQHDYGNKTFMGRSGNFNGEDIIDILLQKRQTAVFIARKFYRYFVNQKANERHVAELADVFYNNQYDIGKTLRYLFRSDWFYAAENVGNKIKSPVDLIAGSLRLLGARFEKTRGVVLLQRAMGQQLFNPPNVAGWPGGRRWIDNASLMLRLNLPMSMYMASDVYISAKGDLSEKARNKALRRLEVELDFTPFYRWKEGQSEEEFFEEITTVVLAQKPRLSLRDLRPYTKRAQEQHFVQTLVLRLMGLPEYQVC